MEGDKESNVEHKEECQDQAEENSNDHQGKHVKESSKDKSSYGDSSHKGMEGYLARVESSAIGLTAEFSKE